MKKFMLLVAIAVSLYGNTSTGAKSSGLVGYWTFDGGNANDLTGNHNGTVVGSGVTFPAGKVGNAVNFSVGTSCIRIPSFNTDNITVEAWVYPTKYGYYTSMVTKSYYASSWSSPWAVWQLWLAENTAQPAIFSPQFGATSPDAISMSQWYHLAFTYDGTTSKLYVNGVEKASSTTSAGAITSTAGNVYIGKPEFANHSFTGSIDEVAIWDNALPGSDILKHYQNGLIGLGYLSAPTVQTDSVTNVTVSTATVTSEVVSENGSEVTARGVCWNTTGNPTTANFKTEDGTGTGEFTSTLTGLTVATTYYVKAYAINSIGTSYGDQFSFMTTGYFTDINAGLPTLNNSTADWGDYDNDGDLDILLTGYSGSAVSKIYRNNAGVFTDINAGLTGVLYASCAWGDYDNDGDLDIILSGAYDLLYNSVSKIYRNDEGIFIDINAGLPSVYYSSVEWGDYDNDGDLDILLTGNTGTSSAPVPISKVYRNNGDGIFTDINAGLYGVYRGPANWGDFDNDGDLDILLAGADGSSNYLSKIYRNDGNGVFTDINAGLEGVYMSSADWGDYDNDGDLDIVIAGYNGSVRIAKIYNNDSGVFTDIEAGLIGKQRGSSAWGDYDNDGDLDLIITGLSVSEGNISKIYRNNAGVFIDIGAGLSATTDNITVWGDYDDDGDLDILMSNNFESAEVYRNNSGVQNSVPSKPALLSADLEKSLLKFSINPGLDTETPQAGLSYNYHIEIDSMIVKPSMAETATGLRRIAMIGNASQNNFYDIDIRDIILPQEDKVLNLSWKVQAIDHCFAGSEFAGIDTTAASYDLKVIKYDQMEAVDLLTWEYLFPDSIADYQLQLDDDINFGSPIEEVLTIDRKKDSKIVNYNVPLNELAGFDSLVSNTRYYWRVKPNYTYRTGRYPAVPASFIYNPTYSIPSPVNISVMGEFVTLTWNNVKDAEKGEIYNVYSSDDPHAVFPEGWTKVAVAYTNEWTVKTSERKKFYCVTAAGSVK
jgi:hypothetical protein